MSTAAPSSDAWFDAARQAAVDTLAAEAAHLALPVADLGAGAAAEVALVAAGFGDVEAAGVVPAAVVMALLESGCRAHGEVSDRSEEPADRRHNRAVILRGDILLVRSLVTAAGLGPEPVGILARTLAAVQQAGVELRRPGGGTTGTARLAPSRRGLLWGGAAELGLSQASVPAAIAACVAGAVQAAAERRPVADVLGRLPTGAATDRLVSFAARHGAAGPTTGVAAGF